MIPRDYITEWRQQVPWTQDAQVEQDLILSRALIEIFSRPFLADNLAFRGGTASTNCIFSRPATLRTLTWSRLRLKASGRSWIAFARPDMTPEAKARLQIDQKLEQAGWIVQDLKQINLGASLGVAVREYPTDTGPQIMCFLRTENQRG